MEIEILKLNINNKKSLAAAVKRAALVLKKGGIIVHPTDTCYGLAADITNEKAVAKVYDFKGRDNEKPLSIIARDFSQLEKYGEYHFLMRKLMAETPDRQFTFVVKRKKTVPDFFNPGEDTVGIQIPKFEFSLALLKKVGTPLTATSANISGLPSCYSVDELIAQIGEKEALPDIIIDAGKLTANPPSRVIKIVGDSFEVLRP